MCASHRFVTGTGTVIVDLCTSCNSARLARDAADERERAAARAAVAEFDKACKHAVSALARALAAAGSPEIRQRTKTVVRQDPRWYNAARTSTATVTLQPGWSVGLMEWAYHALDLDARMPEPCYRSERSLSSMSTWVLESGQVVHDLDLPGREIGFAGQHSSVLMTLAEVAERHGVAIPWQAQEALSKIRSTHQRPRPHPRAR